MQKHYVLLQQLGIGIGILFIGYGVINLNTNTNLVTLFALALLIIQITSIPNSLLVAIKSLKSKYHSKAFTIIMLFGYVVISLYIYYFSYTHFTS